MIRPVTPADAVEIAEIYNHYVKTTVITFEESPVSSDEMKSRIQNITTKYPWIIYETQGKIIGYAYATEWKKRTAYRHTVETTIYLRPEIKRYGIGTILYKELLELLGKNQMHAAIGGIALPNEASIALHEKLGFKKIGKFMEVGYKFDRWIDVGYWELIF
jgi:phosphinothricin acetyltransferase